MDLANSKETRAKILRVSICIFL